MSVTSVLSLLLNKEESNNYFLRNDNMRLWNFLQNLDQTIPVVLWDLLFNFFTYLCLAFFWASSVTEIFSIGKKIFILLYLNFI